MAGGSSLRDLCPLNEAWIFVAALCRSGSLRSMSNSSATWNICSYYINLFSNSETHFFCDFSQVFFCFNADACSFFSSHVPSECCLNSSCSIAQFLNRKKIIIKKVKFFHINLNQDSPSFAILKKKIVQKCIKMNNGLWLYKDIIFYVLYFVCSEIMLCKNWQCLIIRLSGITNIWCILGSVE